jgi:hypothetical protein
MKPPPVIQFKPEQFSCSGILSSLVCPCSLAETSFRFLPIGLDVFHQQNPPGLPWMTTMQFYAFLKFPGKEVLIPTSALRIYKPLQFLYFIRPLRELK